MVAHDSDKRVVRSKPSIDDAAHVTSWHTRRSGCNKLRNSSAISSATTSSQGRRASKTLRSMADGRSSRSYGRRDQRDMRAVITWHGLRRPTATAPRLRT